MSEKFQNKYRIQSVRLQTWDYGWNAAYFITICTQNRKHFFGEIVNHKMQLNAIGIIAENEWLKTLQIRPDMNLTIGEFVVMPNHFHAILIIGVNQYNAKCTTTMQNGITTMQNGITTMQNGCRTTMQNGCRTTMQNGCRTTMQNGCRTTMHRGSTTKNKFGAQSKNLASIIRGFKSAVSINARKINCNFAWQSSYYEHIIRNETEFERIQNYIINNPIKWNTDRFRVDKKTY